MKNNRLISLLLCLTVYVCTFAQMSYEEASIKAGRAFGYREWASASALYNYMLRQQPKDIDTYGRAIVANAQLNDSLQSMDLLKQAMAYNIPIDSVLSKVKKYSFETGNGDLYEHFMLRAARENQWLKRPLDNQLLKYYTFRYNGPKMIEYASTMLNGAPNDIRFLSILAQGYLYEGDTEKAVETWQRIISLKPDDLNALLYLANYYKSAGDNSRATEYFSKAQQLNPTPYVATCLASLGK